MSKSKYIKKEEFVESVSELNEYLRKILSKYDKANLELVQKLCRYDVVDLIKQKKLELNEAIVGNEMLMLMAVIEGDSLTYWIDNNGLPNCSRRQVYANKEENLIGYG